MMVGRCVISIAAVVLCVSAPACAQETEDTSPTPGVTSSMAGATSGTAAVSEGIRQTGSSAFTLREHGVWPNVSAMAGTDTAPRLSHPRSRAQSGTAQALPKTHSSFRRSAWLPWVYAAENRHGLPLGLLDALIWTESRYNPMALSSAGAVGLAQLMPGTARELGVGNRYDPIASIDGGARYLRQMLNRFGSVHLAVAAYNAGPNAVLRAKGIPLNGETPGYVRNVLARWGLF